MFSETRQCNVVNYNLSFNFFENSYSSFRMSVPQHCSDKSEDPIPHKIGLEHEPMFLSLKTAVYWADGMSFISIVFKPGSTYNVTSPVHVSLFRVDYLASKIRSPSTLYLFV